ncbi:hypothetical protein WICMUC_004659 [Wickerhamomyces mucosus]|uniref:RING-type domain-containing protein n=1 Tax=Wickerhamomyces mucosus TaxID=1378264 RepID=A0A9P8PGD1_9ASCO|nr:hypothetical protein WICMUC_004659 [Wickerhamomyces mucosus]
MGVSRKELVKTIASKETLSKIETKEYNQTGRWKTCHLSNESLKEPIVSDYRGNLYNKEKILEYLLDPSSLSDKQRSLISYINSTKDVVNLSLYQKNDEFVCPITGYVLGSNGIKYVYLVKCHHVFAEKCLKEINTESKCPLCNETYEVHDVVIINPITESDTRKLEKRLQDLKKLNLSHSLQKLNKKRKKGKDNTPNTEDPNGLKKLKSSNLSIPTVK